MPKAIKSLTPPKKNLSSKFPNVPAINKLNSRRVSRFFVNKRKKIRLQSNAITQEIKDGIGNPHEIPVLNKGSKKGKEAQTFCE